MILNSLFCSHFSRLIPFHLDFHFIPIASSRPECINTLTLQKINYLQLLLPSMVSKLIHKREIFKEILKRFWMDLRRIRLRSNKMYRYGLWLLHGKRSTVHSYTYWHTYTLNVSTSIPTYIVTRIEILSFTGDPAVSALFYVGLGHGNR